MHDDFTSVPVAWIAFVAYVSRRGMCGICHVRAHVRHMTYAAHDICGCTYAGHMHDICGWHIHMYNIAMSSNHTCGTCPPAATYAAYAICGDICGAYAANCHMPPLLLNPSDVEPNCCRLLGASTKSQIRPATRGVNTRMCPSRSCGKFKWIIPPDHRACSTCAGLFSSLVS